MLRGLVVSPKVQACYEAQGEDVRVVVVPGVMA